MSAALDSLIRQFVNSQQREFAQFASLLSQGDTAGIKALAERVSAHKAVEGITNMIRSSRGHLDELLEKLRPVFNPNPLKFLMGGILMGVGGALMAEATAVIIFMVGFALLLYGFSMAMPAVWEMAFEKINALKSELVPFGG